MRFIRDVNGIERIRTKATYKPKRLRGYEPEKREMSEDTKIRREIYVKTVEMITKGEHPMKVEAVLRDIYPGYSTLIAQLVNDQFLKYNKKANKSAEIKCNDGDER